MAVLHLTNDNFDKTLETGLPVLVDFWAPWCGPCKMLGPVLEEAEKEIGSKAVIAKVCVDDDANLAKKFGIMSIPAILVFKNGKEVDRSVGYVEKERIVELVEKHI